jgi:hypothetical protein
MVKTYIGIDNGISGAIAILDTIPRLHLMPTYKVAKSEYIDPTELMEILLGVDDPFVVFEQGQKNPLFGTKGNFSNGYSFGVVNAVLKLGKIPHTLVNPQTWQKVMFKDVKRDKGTKGASIEVCRRLYPLLSLKPEGKRFLKPHDGMADALMMAAYGKMCNF